MKHQIAVLLHNVRSAHNVGSIFRTADAAGVSKMYLSGYTPVPVDHFGRAQKEIAKTALGAQRHISWEYAKEPASIFSKLRRATFRIVGIEQDTQAHDYRTFKITQPTLLVFGNEVRGLSRSLRDQCDELVEIPMHGTKESLNVAVAAGVILFSTQTH